MKLDVGARWRKVTITVTIKLNWCVILKKEFDDFTNNMELGLGGLRAVAQRYNYSYMKTNWKVSFKYWLRVVE